jgi:hypothetical protein
MMPWFFLLSPLIDLPVMPNKRIHIEPPCSQYKVEVMPVDEFRGDPHFLASEDDVREYLVNEVGVGPLAVDLILDALKRNGAAESIVGVIPPKAP